MIVFWRKAWSLSWVSSLSDVAKSYRINLWYMSVRPYASYKKNRRVVSLSLSLPPSLSLGGFGHPRRQGERGWGVEGLNGWLAGDCIRHHRPDRRLSFVLRLRGGALRHWLPAGRVTVLCQQRIIMVTGSSQKVACNTHTDWGHSNRASGYSQLNSQMFFFFKVHRSDVSERQPE